MNEQYDKLRSFAIAFFAVHVLILFFLFVIFPIFLGYPPEVTPEILFVNKYTGDFRDYKVRLEETAKKGFCISYAPFVGEIINAYRLVFDDTKQKYVEKFIHLTPINENIRPYALTGHDYDGDGIFDRVFIAELQRNGYNSVYRKWWGWGGAWGWEWEPCGADEKKVKPFTSVQIKNAIATLNEAMAYVKKNGKKIEEY
jgi:hypothetical protein